MTVTQTRPRFSEREGRLLLAALYRMRRQEPGADFELDELYAKLERHWGDGEVREGELTRENEALA